MSVVLGRNIASLRAIRALDQSDQSLGRVYERLSTAKRINRASDDAAGLSISDSLKNRARILTRAALNISDAQSLLNIADAAIGGISDVVTRLSELAEQAANGTFSSSQRKALDNEYQLLTREITRLASSTSFNGFSLLKGGRTTANRLIGTMSQNAVADITGDGRYQLSILGGTSGAFQIRDSLTGEIREITGPNGASDTVNDAKILANGDVIFGTTNASVSKLSYYSYSSNSSRVLGSVNSANAFTTIGVSADGTHVAFNSDVAFTDGGSFSSSASAGQQRVYLLDIASNTVRAGLSAIGTPRDFKVSNDGRFVTVGVSGGLYLYNFSSTGGQNAVTLSSSNDSAVGVTSSGIVYLNSAQNLGGQNSTGFSQIFSYNISTATFSRLSNFTSANARSSSVLSADESAIYFTATASLETGLSSGGFRQAFRFDLLSPGATQLTNFTTAVLSSSAKISADGARLIQYQNSNDLYEYDLTQTNSSFDFEAGFGAAGNIILGLGSITASVRGLGSFSLTSALQSRAALDRMTANLELLSQSRSVIGAGQSRLTTASNLALTQSSEITSAAGRIENSEIASESADLTRISIQRQAAAAVLAQSNQQPALALRLLS